MAKSSAYISNISNLRDTLLNSLEFVEWKTQVKKDSTVFIKPNFTYPYYKEGITTTPELLNALLEILKDRADRVIVGESNGGNNSFTADDAFRGHHMHKICKKTGAELINLSKVPSVLVAEKIQGKDVTVQLPKLLLDEIDCFISVPVLKVHVMTKVTLSMKNLWGCYPDTMRCLHHNNLSYKLSLIAKKLNPKLVVIDGIYALDGHGPMYGNSKRTDLIISSNNPVVADSLASEVMGISCKDISHILVAEKEGLGTTCLDDVRINDDWRKFKMNFKIKRTINDNISLILFDSKILTRIAMNSPITPLVYKIARILRNSEENEVVNDILSTKK
ncbi:MAG: DUF362 domain-containing protein [Methanothrix sp.]|nr:DUF362 domain-containing protein [Methanothrix sp.]MDD4409680.1 DUF362 domain-containing protein [Candidatus Paceibacterota bacterium]